MSQDASWARALPSAGAALLIAALGSSTKWTSLGGRVPQQVLRQLMLFLAVLLASTGTAVTGSERISHLALTSLFWTVSPAGVDEACHNIDPTVIAIVAQVAQTAIVCGVQASFPSLGSASSGSSVAFLFAAVVVGVVLPAQALLGRRRQHAEQTAPWQAADASSPVCLDSARTFKRGDIGDGDSQCPSHAQLGAADLSTTQAQLPQRGGGPPPPSRACSAKAALPGSLYGLSPLPASGVQASASGMRSSTDSGGFSGLSDAPDCPAESLVPSRRGTGHSGETLRSPCSSPLAAQTDTAAIVFIANPAAVQSCAVGCQTDDELLVWLFTGGSTAPSAAADDLRDGEYANGGGSGGMGLRASASGEASSPTRHGGEFGLGGASGEGWAPAAYGKEADREAAAGLGYGYGATAAGDASGRSGGVGKYDSFTSVWSRSAHMHTAPYRPHAVAGGSGAASGGSGGVDDEAGPRGSWLDEANLSNGSQQAASAPAGNGKATLAAYAGAAAGLPGSMAPLSRRRSSGINPGLPPQAISQLGSGASPARRGRGNSRSGGAGASGVSSSSGVSSGQFNLPGLSGLLGALEPGGDAAEPQSPRSRREGSRSSSQLPASLMGAAAKPETSGSGAVISAGMSGSATAGSSAPSAGGSGVAGAGAAGAGAAAALNRSLARRQRLQQRSRTFSELSPQRSLALVELAVSGAGAPLVLPPANVDVELLPTSGSGGVNGGGGAVVVVPSPYSEDSAEEDESVRRLRAIRAMRRHHPELAASLDRFASVLQRQAAAPAAAAAAAGTTGAGAGGKGARQAQQQDASHAPEGKPAAQRTSTEAVHEEGQLKKSGVGMADVQRRKRGPVRRTQSFSSLEAAQQRAHLPQPGGATAASPLLRAVLENGGKHGEPAALPGEQQERQAQPVAAARPPAATKRVPAGTPETAVAVDAGDAAQGAGGTAGSAPTTGPPSFEVMFLDVEVAAAEPPAGSGLDSSGSRRWSVASGGSAITITGALNAGRVASERSSTDAMRAGGQGVGSAGVRGYDGYGIAVASAAATSTGGRSGTSTGEGSATGYVPATRGNRTAAMGPALALALGSSDAACEAHMDQAPYRQRYATAAGAVGTTRRQSEALGGAPELAVDWQVIMGARRSNGSVQRSRSAGEASFRPGAARRSGADGDGVGRSGPGEAEERQRQEQRHQMLHHRYHWQYSRQMLPHQEHRRAALLQAWHAMLAEVGGSPSGSHASGGRTSPQLLSASGEAAAHGAASRVAPGLARRDGGVAAGGPYHEPSLVELAGLDVEVLAAAAGGPPASVPLQSGPDGSSGEAGSGSSPSLSGDAAGPDSATPSGSDSPAAAGAPASRGAAATGTVLPAAGRNMGTSPTARTSAGGARAAAQGSAGGGHDDRNARLSKSLSERSLARVVTTNTGSAHYRRVSRTKSRFALLQQADPGEGGEGVGGGAALARHVHRLVRNSSGGSLGSRQLADVEEEDDELMAAEEAAALAAAATARASADGRRPSADDLSAVVELARRSRSSNAGRDSTSTNGGGGGSGAGAGGGRASSSGSGGMLKVGTLSSPGCLDCEQPQPVPEHLESAGGSGRFSLGLRVSGSGAGRSGRVSGAGTGLSASALAGIPFDGEEDAASPHGIGAGSAGTRRRSAWRSASELSFAGLRFGGGSGGPGPRISSASRDADDLALEAGRLSAESATSAAARAALLAADSSTGGGVVSSGALAAHGQSAGSNSSLGSPKRRPGQARASSSSQAGRRRAAAATTAATGSEVGRPQVAGDSVQGRELVVNSDSQAPNGSIRVASVSAGVGGGIGGDDGDAAPVRAAGTDADGAGIDSAAAGELGALESSDSDQELLEVLAAETARSKSARDAAASPLARLRHTAGVPGKVASFRFAAPIVPPSGGSANSTAAGGAAPSAAAPTAGGASPFQTSGASDLAGAEAGASAVDDIPVPPLAAPVVPERELVAAELHAQHQQHHSHRDHHAHSGGGSSTSNVAAGATSGAASSASHAGAPGTAPAALSALNLHEHTRHWEAAAPGASDPASIVAQLASPSPSQSGPIDPLSEPEGASMSGSAVASAAALLQSALESTTGVPSGHAGGGGAGAAGAEGGHVGTGTNAGVGGAMAAQQAAAHGRNSPTPIPRALVAARLSMPLAPYGNSDTTALVAAAATGNTAGGGMFGRGLSRQASATTVGGVSVSASSDGHQSQGADLALVHLPPGAFHSHIGLGAGDDSTGTRSLERPPTNATYISNLSRTPSHIAPSVTTIFGGTQVGGGSGAGAGPARSIIARVNSGGGGGMYGGGGGRGGLPSMVRGQSKLSGGAGGGAGMSGGDTVEAEVEEAVLANRRLQDERAVLMDEINIDKILGFGSMGMVYHGRLYDTKVVIKLIEHGTGVLGKEKERGRLARVEACVSRMLLHPNIVLTYDACTGRLQPGRLAAKLGRGGGGMGGSSRGGGGRQRFMTVMVQEFCELGTLRDAINRRKHGLAGSGPESAVLLYRVALDIANGMKHLAALRVIHADLKAENVLLQRADVSPDRPHGFVAKVADFGLAMVLPPGQDGLKQGIHGTVSHMPPEAMRDTVFSLATDVFSFGVVLWELYTGESPYRGMAPHEVVEAVCARGERPAWPDSTPHELLALAEDCWHTDPDYRPTFGEVVERLRGLLAPARGAPERCPSMLSGMTEESDELEAALRQQRRGAPAPSVRGPTSGGMAGGALTIRGTPSEAGSDVGMQAGAGTTAQRGAAASGIPTADSGVARSSGFDGADAGVPREAPRDPLGLLLWALCQFPAEEPIRVEGTNGPDSVQWVMQVEDMVLRSREDAGPSRSLHSMSASMAGTPPSVVIEEHP